MNGRLLKYKSFIINLLMPALVFGFITGTMTAVIVSFYKLCAKYVVGWSEKGYELLEDRGLDYFSLYPSTVLNRYV